MTPKFDIDFHEALRQVAEFLTRTKEAGVALDKLQKQAGTAPTAAGKLIKEMHTYYSQLENDLRKLGIDVERTGKQLADTRNLAQSMFAGIAAANLKASTAVRGYSGEMKELERLLKDTDAKTSYVKWARQVANLQNDLIGKNKLLKASLEALQTTEGKRNLQLQARLNTDKKIAAGETLQIQKNKELKAQLDLVLSSLGKANAVLQARITAANRAAQEETRLIAKLGESRRAYESLQGGIQAQIAQQNALNQGLAQAATFRQREQNQVDELRRRHESLNGGLAEQAVHLRTLNQTREREITELTRQRAKIEELQRTLQSLNGGEQEQIVRLQEKIRVRNNQIKADEQYAASLRVLTQEEARLRAEEERRQSLMAAVNNATLQAARATQQMTKAEAEAIAKGEALAAANKRNSEALLDEARRAYGMSKAQIELNQARDRAIEQLTRLRSQKALLSTAHGKEMAQLKEQIAEQQRYNRLLTMTTSQLLGLTSAKARNASQMHAGAQSAAMLRAALSGLQTNIGMYTSSTILAASSTYALFSAMRNTVELGAEFTATMARANAIMSTSGPSWLPSSMEAMEAQVRALGQTTIFTASQVAEGLTELGQAGLSASDSITALKPALDLAQIGNISMAESADIATNVMMTFGKEASDLGHIVDSIATSVTNSNTNVQQLANALTYAGPAAHTAGISMEEVSSAIEALANAGIKGSRSGTALRRLFVSLLNPTEKGSAVLQKYGIAVTEADGSTRNLVNILQDLHDALEGVPEPERLAAIQDLVGLYATSSVAALVENVDQMGIAYRRQMGEIEGAAERMKKTMEDSLKWDWRQVVSAYEEAQLQVFDRFEYKMREATMRLSNWLVELTQGYKAIDIATGSEVDLTELERILGEAEDSTRVVITNLDMLIQRASVAAEALAYAFGGLAFLKIVKGGAGGMFAALANDSSKAVAPLTILATRTGELSNSMKQLGQHSQNTAGALRNLQVMGASGAATALGTLSSAAAGTAANMSKIAAAASGVMTALGWVGLLVGIGTALHSVFSTDNEQSIIDQKDRVKELEESYKRLKEQINETALARQRLALAEQIKADQEKIEAINARNTKIQSAIKYQEGQGSPVSQSLKDELADNERIAKELQKSIDAAKKSLEEIPVSRGEVQTAVTDLVDKTLELAKAQEQYFLLRDKAMASPESVDAKELLAAKDRYDELNKSVGEATQTVDNLTSKQATLREEVRRLNAELDEQVAKDVWERNATSAEKLLRVQEEIAKVRAEMDSAAERGTGENLLREFANRLGELYKQQQDLLDDANETRLKIWETEQALARVGQTDAEQLRDAQIELEMIEGQLRQIQALREEGSMSDEVLNEQQLALLERYLEVQQKLHSLRSKADKPVRTTKTDEQRRAEDLEKYIKQIETATAYTLQMVEAYRQGEEAVEALTLKQKIEEEVLRRGEKARAAVTKLLEDQAEAERKLATAKKLVDTEKELKESQAYAKAVALGGQALREYNIQKEIKNALSDVSAKLTKKERDELEQLVKDTIAAKEVAEKFGKAWQLIYDLDPKASLFKDYVDSREALVALINQGGEAADQARIALDRLDAQLDQNLRELSAWGRLTESAIERVDEAFANAWKNIDEGFEGFANGLKDGFKQLLAELAHEAITKPIVISFANHIFGTKKPGGIADVWFGGSDSGSGGFAEGIVGTVRNLYSIYDAFTGVGSEILAGYQSGGISGAFGGAVDYYSKIIQGAYTTVAELFGSTAAQTAGQTATTTVGYGLNQSLVTGALGEAAYAGGTSGAGTGFLSSLTGALTNPVTWITAGMLASWKAYEAGYRADASSMAQAGGSNSILQGAAWTQAGQSKFFEILDKGLTKLSFGLVNDKLAAIISGSSFHQMLWEGLIFGRLFGGGERYERQVGSAAGSFSGGSYTGNGAVESWFNGERRFGDDFDQSLHGLNETFSSSLTKLFEMFDIESEISTETVARLRRTSGKLLAGFTASFDDAVVSISGQYAKDANIQGGLEAFFDDVMGRGLSEAIAASQLPEYLKELTDGLKTAAEVSETLSGLFYRFDGVNATLEAISLNAYELTDAGMRGADALLDLVSAMAGLEDPTAADKVAALTGLTSAYYENFFTEAERADATIRSVTAAFEQAGVPLADTRDGFRSMVEDIDLTTEAGREMFVTMMNLAGQAATYFDIVESRANAALMGAVDTAYARLERSIEAERNRLTREYQAALAQEQAAAQAAQAAAESRRSSLQDMAATAEEQAQMLRRLTSALDKALQTLIGNTEAAAESMRRQSLDYLRSALAAANNGKSLAGWEKLEDAINASVAIDANAYESFADFEAEQGRTANLLADLRKVAGRQLTAEEKLAEQLRASAASINTSIGTVSSKLTAEYQRAMDALDKELDAAQAQLDALNGIDNSILTVTAAVAQMSAAVVSALNHRTGNTDTGAGVHSSMISQLYTSILGYDADIEGQTHWQGRLAAGETYSDLIAALNLQAAAEAGGSTNDVQAIRDRLRWQAATGVPMFAKGGYHTGGWRVVGEDGPELEFTGPSRILSNKASKELLSGDSEMAEAFEKLANAIDRQGDTLRAIAKHSSVGAKTTNLLERFVQLWEELNDVETALP